MNVLQMYWLRYSGHAAFQTKDMVKILGPGGGAGAVAKLPRAVMLQSAEDEKLFQTVIDHSATILQQSMFMAFYSFNEADVDARDKIRKQVAGFGRFLLAIHHEPDGHYGWMPQKDLGHLDAGNPEQIGVEVVQDFTKWFTELQKTHNTCVWDFKQKRNSYYAIAILKELGDAKCLPELNCNAKRIHPTIPSTCSPLGIY
eukprot:SAG31_NODE_5493_length_2502_cov_4.810653_2_plen_200_part_00